MSNYMYLDVIVHENSISQMKTKFQVVISKYISICSINIILMSKMHDMFLLFQISQNISC